MGEETKEFREAEEDFANSLFGEKEVEEAVKEDKKGPKKPEPTEEADRPLKI